MRKYNTPTTQKYMHKHPCHCSHSCKISAQALFLLGVAMTREQIDEPRMSLVCARAKQGVLNRFQTLFGCACEKDLNVICRRDGGAHTHNHSFLVFEFTVAGLEIADTVLVRSDKACRLTVTPKEKWWKALCYSELARLLEKRKPSMSVLNIAQAKISEASPELRSALDEEGRQRLVLPLAHVRDDRAMPAYLPTINWRDTAPSQTKPDRSEAIPSQATTL